MTQDPLTPYRRFLTGDRHAALARHLLTWSLQHCACERGTSWHARNSFYAATFATYCAPADATWPEMANSGKFLVVYFSVDDGPREELLLLAEQLGSRRAPDAGELGRLHGAFLADLRASSVTTAHVERGLASLCAAAAAEGTHDVREMTYEQFHTLRRSTIGTDGFIDLWRGMRRLPVPHGEDLVTLATEAVYLANDLASLEKEALAGGEGAGESNYVLFTAARSSRGVEAAVAEATERYNRLVGALAEAPPGPLAALLGAVVDGNLRAHLALSATRFPGAARRLRHLEAIHRTAPGDPPR